MKTKSKNNNKQNNKQITNLIMILPVLILIALILMLLNLKNENNNNTKYNYRNLKILKYYPYENKFPTIMHLSADEKSKLMKILDNETFEENKNYTDCLGILKYKIKFDDYTININTECSTNTLQKNNKSKKLVNLSDKLINYVKEIDEKREKK